MGVDLRCPMNLAAEQEDKLIALCERIGMPWEKVYGRDNLEHAWNGHALNIAHGNPNGTSDLVHEVAHWLTASPGRRSDPGFGLDDMAYWRDKESTDGLPDPAASIDEEIAASLLGILLERTMGMDWRYTWEFHRWHVEGWKGVRGIIRTLQQRGLIRGLVPTVLLPPWQAL